MSRRLLQLAALLLAAHYLSGCGETRTASPKNSALTFDGILTEATPAYVWTGKEVIVWKPQGLPLGYAFDPAGRVRQIRENPRALGRSTQGDPYLLWMGQGKVLVAYSLGGMAVHIDYYYPDRDEWEAGPDLDGQAAGVPEKDPAHPGNTRWVVGGVRLDDGALILAGASWWGTSPTAVRIGPTGKAREYSLHEVFAEAGSDPALLRQGNRVMVLMGGSMGSAGKVWDAAADRWRPFDEKPWTYGSAGQQPFGQIARHYFGRCLADGKPFVFGGLAGSGSTWALNDGAVFSMDTRTWRLIPLEGAPEPRGSAGVCWTGRDVFVWGGIDRDFKPVTGGALFDPQRWAWSPISVQGAPDNLGGCRAVWTGREVIVWAFWPKADGNLGTYAYDPQTGQWSKLYWTVKQAPGQ
jgi:hypothetical protein